MRESIVPLSGGGAVLLYLYIYLCMWIAYLHGRCWWGSALMYVRMKLWGVCRIDGICFQLEQRHNALGFVMLLM